MGWKSIADIETWTKVRAQEILTGQVSSEDVSHGNVRGWNIWSWQRVFLPKQMRVFSPHHRRCPEMT